MAIRSARQSLAITPAKAMLTHYNIISSNNINHTIMAITSAINLGNKICHSNLAITSANIKQKITKKMT